MDSRKDIRYIGSWRRCCYWTVLQSYWGLSICQYHFEQYEICQANVNCSRILKSYKYNLLVSSTKIPRRFVRNYGNSVWVRRPILKAFLRNFLRRKSWNSYKKRYNQFEPWELLTNIQLDTSRAGCRWGTPTPRRWRTERSRNACNKKSRKRRSRRTWARGRR